MSEKKSKAERMMELGAFVIDAAMNDQTLDKPCEYGHIDCSSIDKGACWNELEGLRRAADRSPTARTCEFGYCDVEPVISVARVRGGGTGSEIETTSLCAPHFAHIIEIDHRDVFSLIRARILKPVAVAVDRLVDEVRKEGVK